MIRDCKLLFDYQINDSNSLLKLLDLSPLPFMSSFNTRTPNINIWFITSLKIHSVLKGHSDHIFDMVFSSSIRLLFTSSLDSTVKFWNPITSQCVITVAFEDYIYRLIKLQITHDFKLFIYEGMKKISNIYPILCYVDIFKRKIIKELKSSETSNEQIKDLVDLNEKTMKIAYCLLNKIVIFNYELEFIVKILIDSDKLSIKTIKYFQRESEECLIVVDSSNYLKIWNIFNSQITKKIQINEIKLWDIEQIVLIKKFDFRLVFVYSLTGIILIVNIQDGKIEEKIIDFVNEKQMIFHLLVDGKRNRVFVSGENGRFKGFKLEFC